ncbi:hypothetical protein SLS58_001662 [Diplodia intermedia]|uniref:Uncharacterized protein n=1 Tax=Diplodia intermedia TaxID=856260 RepID=A0ABR3U1R2_9PEZI
MTLCEITTSSSDNGEASCGVKAVRHTSGLPVSGNLTALDEPTAAASMLQAIPFVLSSRHPRDPGTLDKLLKDPLSIFKEKYDTNTWYYEDMSLNLFQARLGMLLNTFIRASYDMPSLVGMKSMTWDNETEWANTTGIWTEFTEDIYDIQIPWFTLYMASTIVLTLCGLVNVVLRTMIRAPDFLGSISALTRDTPFVDAPPGGSTMDGTDRARLLKDKWVRIQDVKPDEEVGRIAFSDAKGPGGLRIGRRYE